MSAGLPLTVRVAKDEIRSAVNLIFPACSGLTDLKNRLWDLPVTRSTNKVLYQKVLHSCFVCLHLVKQQHHSNAASYIQDAEISYTAFNLSFPISYHCV